MNVIFGPHLFPRFRSFYKEYVYGLKIILTNVTFGMMEVLKKQNVYISECSNATGECFTAFTQMPMT